MSDEIRRAIVMAVANGTEVAEFHARQMLDSKLVEDSAVDVLGITKNTLLHELAYHLSDLKLDCGVVVFEFKETKNNDTFYPGMGVRCIELTAYIRPLSEESK